MRDQALQVSGFRYISIILSLLLLFFIVAPLASLFMESSPKLSGEMIRDREVINAIITSLEASVISVLILLITGVPLAYLLARHVFPGKQLIEALVDLPLVMPHAVAGIMILTAFGSRGLMGGFLRNIGFIIEDNFKGIIIVMTFVSIPLLVDTVKVGFQLIGTSLEAVARSLGASEWQAFSTITLPLSYKHILAGALLGWARGLSEVGALLVVAYYPKTVNILILEYLSVYGLKYAATLSAIYALIILAIFAVLKKVASE
ncbi:MAG: ABC transporter permease [Desulfurococcales archaeon]|nr:ABC transporter permease [Desulfurococcales archaeon]